MDFTKKEKILVKSLGLDSKSVVTDRLGITTFGETARMYYESLRLVPITAFNLGEALNYRNKDRHFWATDAGIGTALAYTQQALFTLELSLKAVLEALGKLEKPESGNRPDWHTHDLIDLFDLLEAEHKQKLEQRWASLMKSDRHFAGTLAELFDPVRDSYEKWRYIPQLKDAPSMNTGALLSASGVLLNYADHSLRLNFPLNIKVTTEILTEPEGGGGRNSRRTANTVIVEGVVRCTGIPEGHDPHGKVEVVIDSDHHDYDVTAVFNRTDVESYYGLEGVRVVLGGTSFEDEPYVLNSPQHVGDFYRVSETPSYSFEHRTLKGSVYNLKAYETAFKLSQTNLTLKDETYFTEVDCLFLTDEERKQLDGVRLGDDILISGIVTLMNGRPIRLVGPEKIERVETGPEH